MDSRESYVAVAVTRAKELPTRLAFAVFIAAAATYLTRDFGPAVWLLAVVVAQFLDWWVCRPLRAPEAAEPTDRQTWPYVASGVFNTAVYSAIAAYLWFEGGEAGRVFGFMQPAGGLIHIGMHMHSARRLFLASAVPHAAYLLCLPMAMAIVTPEKDFANMAVATSAGVLFVLHLFVAVRRTAETSAELRAARDQAEAERTRAELASAAKSNFLATISHEIRTPMNAVVAGADLLGRTRLTKAQAAHVAMLANSSEVLLGLLNDVLDLSKIEARKLELETLPVDLSGKLQAAADLWAPRAAEKGVVFRQAWDGLPARAMLDPLRFQQIVFNLLSNAVKFTAHGQISLHAGPTGDGRFFVEVADTGCGMTPEQATRVFESFEQAHAGTTRQHGGTGLGLAISRQLAELMGGTITVSSAPGSGSTFRLELPLIEAAAPAAAGAPDQAPAPAMHSLDVLLAEDHEVNQRIVRLYLEPLGCRVTIANDGAEAVAAARERAYDLILMDMQMPVLDGVEATRRIRSEAGPNASTPIIAVTANALREHRDQWAAVGVTHFVTKPLNVDRLLESVEAALSETAAEQAPLARAHA